MKKTAKLMSVLLVLIMLVSVFALSIHGEIGELVANYDDYGYYAYFDFENYGTSGSHLTYMRSSTAKNADGLSCDPFDFMSGNGYAYGTKKIESEGNGNKYYHYTTNGGSDYNVIAVFVMQDSCIVGDAAEVSFRFRMSKSDADTGTEAHRIQLINARRGSSGNQAQLTADIYGNLYAYVNGEMKLVYTNGNGTTVGGDGEFMNIAFRWYDVTNTYSVFVNGDPVVEAMPLSKDFRGSTFISQTYNDDFGVEERTVIGDDRTIEVIRVPYKNGEKFTFDVDDVKLSRVESAQKGSYYYSNSFDGVYDGMTSLIGNSSYAFTGTHNAQTDEDGNRLGYFSVADGTTVSIRDDVYQQFTQDSIVVDFKVRGEVTHIEGYTPLLRIMNGGGLNTFNFLYADPDGVLYTEYNEETGVASGRIDGYKLDGSDWLNIAIVAMKNTDNSGKFGSFKSSSDESSNDNTYYFNYYINGNFVGTASQSYVEWKSGYTASNHSYVIKDYTIGGDVEALDLTNLTLVDGTTTANHKIYKTADGLTYYDITFDSNGNQTKYSAMALTRAVTEDSICFFADATFKGGIDDIKVYEGTAPENVYANANSALGGNVVNVDFASVAFPTKNIEVKTHSSGADVLGTFMTSGVTSNKVVHKDAKGNTITAATTENSNYSTVTFGSGNWFDFFVPMPQKTNDVYDFEYSFETTIKNIGFNSEDSTVPTLLGLFTQRLENDSGYNSNRLMSVDSSFNIYGGNEVLQLYDENGNQAKIDNEKWNTLRCDIHYYQDGTKTVFELSYYLDGEILYLEDGSPAYRIVNSTIIPSTLLSRFGGSNYRVRYTQMSSGNKISLDIKSINISANAKPIYNKVTSGQANINDNVTVIELKAPKYTSDKFDGVYDLLSLTKTSAGKEYKLPLITVNPYTGKVYIGMSGFDYELCDSTGAAYTVADATLSVAVVYNDIYGKTRYYVNGTAAYINLGGKLTAAAELLTDDPTFANLDNISTAGYVLFGGCGIGEDVVDTSVYNLNTYNVNDGDTAEIVGFQSNSITDGLRIIAGVDTLYYNKVGFEMETFVDGVSKGLKDISDNVVFSSVVAEDKNLPAQSQGYNFFAAAVVTELPEKFTADTYIEVRSYTEIAGTKHYDEKTKIVVTDDGYYFDNDGVIYQNDFNDLTEIPSNFVKNGLNSTVALDAKGMIDFDSTADTFSTYYLNQYVGSDYLVQADITVDDTTAADGYFGLVGRLQSSSKYIEAGVRLNGAGGWIEADGGGGSLKKFVPSDMSLSFKEGGTYTLTLICKDDTATFFVDGTPVAEATIPEGYETGKVGVCTSGVSIGVDNFIVRTVEDLEDSYIMHEDYFTDITEAPEEWDMNKKATRYSPTDFTKSVSDGQLVLSSSSSGNAIELKKDFDYTDYVYEADITMIGDGVRAGLMFGLHEDKGKHAYTQIRFSNASAVASFTNDSGDGTFVTFGEGTLAAAPVSGEKHHVKMVMDDGYVTFYVDAAKIITCEITDKDCLSGRFGIWFRGGTVNVDNVRLYKMIDKYEITDTSGEGTRIRVATFNLGDFSTASGSSGDGIANGNGTEKTKEEYRAVFEKVGADIWGLQEDSQYFNGTTKESPYDAIYSTVHTNHERNFTRIYNGMGFLTSFDVGDVEPVYYEETTTPYSPDTPVGYSHPWFLTGKVMVDGKEIHIATLHFEWRCRYQRAQQIEDVLAWAKDKEYCIILGDFNPQDYIKGDPKSGDYDPDEQEIIGRLNPGSNNVYQEDWAKFIAAGFEPANGGRFGVFGTLTENGVPKLPYPWDNVFVSSNIKIVNAEPVYESWMNDHAIFVADIEIN